LNNQSVFENNKQISAFMSCFA